MNNSGDGVINMGKPVHDESQIINIDKLDLFLTADFGRFQIDEDEEELEFTPLEHKTSGIKLSGPGWLRKHLKYDTKAKKYCVLPEFAHIYEEKKKQAIRREASKGQNVKRTVKLESIFDDSDDETIAVSADHFRTMATGKKPKALVVKKVSTGYSLKLAPKEYQKKSKPTATPPLPIVVKSPKPKALPPIPPNLHYYINNPIAVEKLLTDRNIILRCKALGFIPRTKLCATMPQLIHTVNMPTNLKPVPVLTVPNILQSESNDLPPTVLVPANLIVSDVPRLTVNTPDVFNTDEEEEEELQEVPTCSLPSLLTSHDLEDMLPNNMSSDPHLVTLLSWEDDLQCVNIDSIYSELTFCLNDNGSVCAMEAC
jgi:hypothetical protein